MSCSFANRLAKLEKVLAERAEESRPHLEQRLWSFRVEDLLRQLHGKLSLGDIPPEFTPEEKGIANRLIRERDDNPDTIRRLAQYTAAGIFAEAADDDWPVDTEPTAIDVESSEEEWKTA